MSLLDTVVDTERDKSLLFLAKFGSKFHHDYDVSVVPRPPARIDASLDNIDITRGSVRKALLNL
jgi:hypothetical protein